MRIRRQLRYPQFNPDAPAPAPLNPGVLMRYADAALGVTTLLALLAMTDEAVNIITVLAFSLIGIPLALLMTVAVPLAALLVPWRIMYVALRHRLSKRMSLVIAMTFAALMVNALDLAFKAGKDGRALAEEMVADQPALTPVSIPASGLVGLRYDMGNTRGLRCLDLCEALLTDGTARQVVSLTLENEPYARYYMANADGSCQGVDRTTRGRRGICEQRNTRTQPDLVFDLVKVTAAEADDSLASIWEVTIRAGAMSQQTRIIEAYMPVGGGLSGPFNGDNSRGPAGYFAKEETVIVAPRGMEHLEEDGVWHRGVLWQYTKLVQTLIR